MKTCNQIRKEYQQNKRIKTAIKDLYVSLKSDHNLAWKAMEYLNETLVHQYRTPYTYKFELKASGVRLEFFADLVLFVTKDQRSITDMRKLIFAMGYNGELPVTYTTKKTSYYGGLRGTRKYTRNEREYYLAY